MEKIIYFLENHIVEKKSNDYFILLNFKYNALFLFDKDVETFWNYLIKYNSLSNLYNNLSLLGYTNSIQEIKEIIILFSQLGIIKSNIQIEDIHIINEYNQLQEYCSSLSEKGIPTILQIELTNNCNLKCIHCYQDLDRTSLNKAKIIEVINQLSNTSIIKLTLTGGEVGLYDDWKEIVKVAQENNLMISMISNLTKFSESDLRFIKDNHIEIKTSIYGNNPHTHDKITGVDGSYNSTLSRIKMLHRLNANLSIGYMIMKDNIHEVTTTKEFFEDMDIPIIFDVRLIPKRSGNVSVQTKLIDPKDLHKLLEDGIIQLPKKIHCSAFKYRLMIDSFGNLYGCDMLLAPAGNILKSSFLDNISSKKYLKLKEKVEKYNPITCNACNKKIIAQYVQGLLGIQPIHLILLVPIIVF